MPFDQWGNGISVDNNSDQGAYHCFSLLVIDPERQIGVTGFEPATPCTPCMCATKLRHTPMSFANEFNQKFLVGKKELSCFLYFMKAIKIAVLGASGYTGIELLRLILMHPYAELTCVTSRQHVGEALEDVFPRFHSYLGAKLTFSLPEPDSIASTGAELAFLALPHGVAAEYASKLIALGLKVIDLSADFRLSDPQVYEDFYGQPHPDPVLLEEAVYGLPEIHRDVIKNARLVASPGCYPTSIELPLIPLLKAKLISHENIIIHSMSGVSGAGRKADLTLSFCECNESLRAYGVPRHRHLSEIEQELSLATGKKVVVSFTPHLVPVQSGICTTSSVPLTGDVKQIQSCFETAYASEPFVRLLGKGKCPDTKNVTRTNFVDIGWEFDPRTNRVLLFSAEDNLCKGAGGQAIQSFNIIYGLPETTGLMHL
jgi:N-acetyl-gamma-glutamyl-phosphate reductase